MEDQQNLWNKIAKEWHEFKTESDTKKDIRVIEFLNTQEGNILDLGGGSGRYLQKIKNGKIYLVDFSEEMLKLAQEKAKKENIPVECIQATLESLPFEDTFFDGFIFIAALHCVETKAKRDQTIKELYRVLKPGAKGIIAVFNKASKRFKNAKKEKLIGWRDLGKRYYYLYDTDELKEVLESQGFESIEHLEHSVNIMFKIRKPKKN